MPVAQTFTVRAAVAIARAEYLAMWQRAFANVDPRTSRVAERAFLRGNAALQAMEATSTDIALSEHADDALHGYLASLRVADVDSAFTWLDLFPEMVRDVRRDAEVRVKVNRTVKWLQRRAAAATVVPRDEETFRSPANKQPALALAA
jgi:hypothetical protein